MLYLLIQTLLLGLINAEYISDYSPQTGVVFPEGGDAVLTCRSPAPWYLCIWEGPGGIACTCQLSAASGTLCSGYQKVTLTGSGNECVATVSGVSFEDAGDWKCNMISTSTLNKASQNLVLNVGRAAVVSWVNVAGSVNLNEGDSHEWTCEALGGYPKPVITVTGPDGIQTGKQDTTSSKTAPFVDSSIQASYTGNNADDNSNIICTATQYSDAGALLYESEADFSIKVAVVPVALLSIGEIIGIIFAVLFLILLLILLCCCCFFWYKKNKSSDKNTTVENNIYIDHDGVYINDKEKCKNTLINEKETSTENAFLIIPESVKETNIINENQLHNIIDTTYVKNNNTVETKFARDDDELKTQYVERTYSFLKEKDIYEQNAEVFVGCHIDKEYEICNKPVYEDNTTSSEKAFIFIPEGQKKCPSNTSNSSSSSSSNDNSHLATSVISSIYDADTHFNNVNVFNGKETNIDKCSEHNQINNIVNTTYVRQNNTVETNILEQNIGVIDGCHIVKEIEIGNKDAAVEQSDGGYIYAKKLSSSSSSSSSSSKQSSVVDQVMKGLQEAGNHFHGENQHPEILTSSAVLICKEESRNQTSADNIKPDSFGKFDKNKSKKRITSILKKERDWKNNLSNITEERLSQMASMEDLRKSLEELQRSQENLEQTGQTKYMYTNIPSVLVSKIDTTKFQDKGSSITSESESRNENVIADTITEETQEEIQNNLTEEKNYRRYNDEHYYIGTSEYAEVVQEHVNGKFEDDLGYYTEKSNEQIHVNHKIWKLEEIAAITETQSIHSTSGVGRRSETPLRLPDTPPQNDSFKHNYIEQWISTENVAAEFSPTSNPGSSQNFGFNDTNISKQQQHLNVSTINEDQSDIEELDKSDESCIVTAEHTRKESFDSTRSSNAFYHDQDHFIDNLETKREETKQAKIYKQNQNVFQHIADYHKIKQENQLNINTSSFEQDEYQVVNQQNGHNVTGQIKTQEYVKHTSTEYYTNVSHPSRKDRVVPESLVVPLEQPDVIQSQYSNGFDINFSNSNSSNSESRPSATRGRNISKVLNETGSSQDADPDRHVYRITQHEITMFSKNPQGRIKIIQRPIVNTTARSIMKSMPDLQISHTELDGQEEEVSDKIDNEDRSEDHLHMHNVGLIQQSLPMKQFLKLGTQSDGSSGSVFDCDMRCFRGSTDV